MSQLLPRVTLASLRGLGVLTLARLTHQAEDAGDDVTFLALQAEIEGRPAAEQEAYRLAWIDLHRVIMAERKAGKAP